MTEEKKKMYRSTNKIEVNEHLLEDIIEEREPEVPIPEIYKCLICGAKYKKLFFNACKGCLSSFNNKARKLERGLLNYTTDHAYILNPDFINELHSIREILSGIMILINGYNNTIITSDSMYDEKHCCTCDIGIRFGEYNCEEECYGVRGEFLPLWRPLQHSLKNVDVGEYIITSERLYNIFLKGLKKITLFEDMTVYNNIKKMMKDYTIEISIRKKEI